MLCDNNSIDGFNDEKQNKIQVGKKFDQDQTQNSIIYNCEKKENWSNANFELFILVNSICIQTNKKSNYKFKISFKQAYLW